MSLTVAPDLLQKAEAGNVTDAEFAQCVRESLPYAYDLVAGLAAQLGDQRPQDRIFADNRTEPPSEQHRAQLLRAMASDAIRGVLGRHFAVRIAFQNCHRVAVFAAGADADGALARFTSVPAQLLNQSPDLVNC
jgi:hypothetical protein